MAPFSSMYLFVIIQAFTGLSMNVGIIKIDEKGDMYNVKLNVHGRVVHTTLTNLIAIQCNYTK